MRRRRALKAIQHAAVLGAVLLLPAVAVVSLATSGSAVTAPAATARLTADAHVPVTVGPPPALRLARRITANTDGSVRLTATPSTLPAAGGTVHLHARVRSATTCRFSAAGKLRKLPATAVCASGRASVAVVIPKNTSSARRQFVLYLTVEAAHKIGRTVRDVIVERRASGGQTLSGVTAASGVKAPGAGGDQPSGASNAANAAVAPAVTAQPTDQNVPPGAPVAFSAAASGNPTPSVQWQVSANAGASWSDTSPTFAASANENGYQYRAVFTNTAGAVTTNAVTLTVAAVSTQNFSGYIDYAASGQAFTAVSATWIVPTVSCQPGATSWAAQWPGIGDGTTVQQDGTETDCFGGTPSYWAWYEMYGDPVVNDGDAVPLSSSTYPVSAGDRMSGSVSLTGSNWVLTLADATQNWTFETQIAAPAGGLSQGSAEWMVEDPNGCTPQCETLAPFSPVQFSGATATANGQSGPISGFPATAMVIDQNSAVLATPSPIDATGGGFTDTWLAG